MKNKSIKNVCMGLEGMNCCIMKRMWILITIAFIIMAVTGCVSKPVETTGNETLGTPVANNETLIQEKIKDNLIGMEITYTGFGGEILNYTIKESDIKMINKTMVNSRNVWKVRIGEAKAWDFYLDENGDNIVKSVQLFRT